MDRYPKLRPCAKEVLEKLDSICDDEIDCLDMEQMELKSLFRGDDVHF